MGLVDTFVRQVKHRGAPAGEKYADGGGLYLHVKAAGKYWRMDYAFLGKRKTLAIGVYPAVSLLKARQRRDKAKEQLADGIDPSAAKKQERKAAVDAATSTFEVIARAWHKTNKAERGKVTQAKVLTWLEKDVFPTLGAMPIKAISPQDVLQVARRMEARGVQESAHRISRICGHVFRYAVGEGLADRDVTADLSGNLAPVRKGHFAAITKPELVGPLLRAIEVYGGHIFAASALRLAPMLFVRPGELRAAEWTEMDLDAGIWEIPAERMKMKQAHVVPLATQAVAILRRLHPVTGEGRFVFPSIRTGERPMSENTINAALRSLGYDSTVMTGHGFRAMARTIMDEVLGERVDLIEHQLAHTVKDANGRAYNRTAHLAARREMMQRWADYLEKLRA
ncbi:integrase arm-type DNA-binding domain-containing protein [Pseudorhodoferax sp. Leaf267]|uniref:tyrosine-type recombinase/integrase n=1 Tax=Pseudorhodoferax sp. Leaf267 TaxID=1736316 RepID=UPI0006F8757B|nr:integrase arm-type DNA-binding domain-containing protein [Pseudorhodoferax sp. Leaf267]KQP20551.1 integrase [Pseudorhodoferax sp. Leaf267]